MSGEPGHDAVEIMQRLGFGRGGLAYDDDFDLKRARGLDLGVGRAPAAILRHQRFDLLALHERKFVGERERTARKDQLAVGEAVDLRRPVDCPYDVAMLRGSRESAELQSALREEDCSPLSPESVDGVVHCCDLDPAIAGLACPGKTGEDHERRTARPAGCDGVGGHARGERMRRVDDGVDALAGEKCSQPLSAAEAADALGNWRLRRMGRRPRKGQDRRNIGLVSKPSRKRAGFRRAAENEQAKALQGAAP
jgi:hypothetical protein